MTNKQAREQIEKELEGLGYHIATIDYHADYRHFGHHEAERGCFVELHEAYAEPRRFYAPSYAELVDYVKEWASYYRQ